MALNLSGNKRERVKVKTFNGSDKEFENTPYYGEDFSITIGYTGSLRLKANVFAKVEAEETEGKEALEKAKTIFTQEAKSDEEGNIIEAGVTLYDSIITDLVQNKYIVVAAIRDWSGINDANGAPLECNDQNIIELIEDNSMMELYTVLLTGLIELSKPTETEKVAIDAVGESYDGLDGSTDPVEEILE